MDYGEVTGIELDPDAAELARGRGLGEVRVGRLEELPWPDASFDLITCLDVIEHTPDDRATLRELRRVCRPGGFLLVTVPAYQLLWSLHDEANHHYRRYSRRMLREAAADAGWAVDRTSSFNSLLLAPGGGRAPAPAPTRPPATATPTTSRSVPPGSTTRSSGHSRSRPAGWPRRHAPAGLSLLAVLRKPWISR